MGLVKGAGVIGTYLGPCLTGYDMYQKANDNDPATNVTVRDKVDLTVGTVGVAGAAGTYFGIISNPVGWVIGGAVGIYGLSTFMYDNRAEIQQGMEARQNYIQQGLMPLR